MIPTQRHRLSTVFKRMTCLLLLGHLGHLAFAQDLFEDVSEAAGVAVDGLHHAVAIGDFDRDGREDIY